MPAITKVTVLPFDESRAKPFGPAVIEHRTAQAEFGELGTYFMTFPDGGRTDPWTLRYEESIYVISGDASLLVVGDEGEFPVQAGAGELIALPEGATVRYGGEPGTRLLLSIAPVDWARADRPRKQSGEVPRVLFLTPFHFEKPEHDDKFDAVLTSLLEGHGEQTVSAEHVEPFESVDIDYDTAQTQAILKAVEQANADNYDAIVIACHYDPALTEAREASRIPVVGPLQLTTGVTTQFGPKFAVITDIPEAVEVIGGLIDGYGRGADCVGVAAIGWDGDAILEDPRGAAEAVDRIVAELAVAGEAQSLVIGCTIVSSAYEQYRQEFPDRGVVVLNSNLVALKGAAALAAN
ncbi:aspartate/glutamate racemase family protein [Streptomyces sp. 351MFTsu5.1]|uniref:aspartate/glutamate racemase family protein n=1 Tax=Streptomyces sp. 351MFTsu5.1 TaxID=1172180 RepID=UPI00036A6FAF|nr:aspartate/glutamate racemase family protein [Streptomyces sp. 351MFTsu5.1]